MSAASKVALRDAQEASVRDRLIAVGVTVGGYVGPRCDVNLFQYLAVTSQYPGGRTEIVASIGDPAEWFVVRPRVLLRAISQADCTKEAALAALKRTAAK